MCLLRYRLLSSHLSFIPHTREVRLVHPLGPALTRDADPQVLLRLSLIDLRVELISSRPSPFCKPRLRNHRQEFLKLSYILSVVEHTPVALIVTGAAGAAGVGALPMSSFSNRLLLKFPLLQPRRPSSFPLTAAVTQVIEHQYLRWSQQ